jgi:hypothetical protein
MGLEDLLWFYILKEAEARGAGNQLGPVGGRIVAEVPSHCWAPMVHRISPRRRPSAGTVICSSQSAVASAGGQRGKHVTVTRPESPSDTGGALG